MRKVFGDDSVRNCFAKKTTHDTILPKIRDQKQNDSDCSWKEKFNQFGESLKDVSGACSDESET